MSVFHSFFMAEVYYNFLLTAPHTHKSPMRKPLSLSHLVFLEGNCSPERSSNLPKDRPVGGRAGIELRSVTPGLTHVAS